MTVTIDVFWLFIAGIVLAFLAGGNATVLILRSALVRGIKKWIKANAKGKNWDDK